MITQFNIFLNENIKVKTGDVFSFNDILARLNNDRKRAIPQFKRMILGRRIQFTGVNRRGRNDNVVIVPARAIVWANHNYFKLFTTKNLQDPNEILLSFNARIEILSSVKQIFHDELDPYGEELWEVQDELTERIHSDIDPYGEEKWEDEAEEIDRRNRMRGEEYERAARRRRQEYAETRRRGEEMYDEWCRHDHDYKTPGFGRIFGDRKVAEFTKPFPGIAGDYPRDVAGGLVLSDFYDDDTHSYTCPKCFKVSRHNREHGTGWICGKCGLKSRNWGNGLLVWE
jgi:predicted RNA-binding Zn-ribbon protein involved in translation (DUF1610 family)